MTGTAQDSFHNYIQCLIEQELLLIWLEPLQDNSRGTVQNWTLFPWQPTERDAIRTPQFSSVFNKSLENLEPQLSLQTWCSCASLCLPHSQHKGRNKESGHCCSTLGGEWTRESLCLPRHPLPPPAASEGLIPTSCSPPGSAQRAKRNSREILWTPIKLLGGLSSPLSPAVLLQQ